MNIPQLCFNCFKCSLFALCMFSCVVNQFALADSPTSGKIVILNPAKSDTSRVRQKPAYKAAVASSQALQNEEKEEEKEPQRPVGAVGKARAFYYFQTSSRDGEILFPAGESIEILRLRDELTILSNSSWNEYAPAAASTPVSAPTFFGAPSREAMQGTTATIGPTAAPQSAAPQSAAPQSAAPQSAAPQTDTPQTDTPQSNSKTDDTSSAQGKPPISTDDSVERDREAASAAALNQINHRESMLKAFDIFARSTAPEANRVQGASPAAVGGSSGGEVRRDLNNGFEPGAIKHNGTLAWSQSTPEWQLWYFVDMKEPAKPRLTIKAVVSNRTAFSWDGAHVVLKREGSPWQYHVESCIIPSASVALVTIASVSRLKDGQSSRTVTSVSNVLLDSTEGNVCWDAKTASLHYAVQLTSGGEELPTDQTWGLVVTRDNEATVISDQRPVSLGKKSLWLLDEAQGINFSVKAEPDRTYPTSVLADGVATKVRKTTSYTIKSALDGSVVIIPVDPPVAGNEDLPKDLPANAAQAADYTKGYLTLTFLNSPVSIVADRFIGGGKINLLTDSIQGLESKFAITKNDDRLDKAIKDIKTTRGSIEKNKGQIAPLNAAVTALRNARYANLTSQLTSSSDRILEQIEARLQDASSRLAQAVQLATEDEEKLRLQVFDLESLWQVVLRQPNANSGTGPNPSLNTAQKAESVSASPVVATPSPSDMQPSNALPSKVNSSILTPSANGPTEFVPGASIPAK